MCQVRPPSAPHATDFDGDGDLDLILAEHVFNLEDYACRFHYYEHTQDSGKGMSSTWLRLVNAPCYMRSRKLRLCFLQTHIARANLIQGGYFKIHGHLPLE